MYENVSKCTEMYTNISKGMRSTHVCMYIYFDIVCGVLICDHLK